ncbi:MAG: hypothetical protein JW981_02730 [Anaerolineae bacterium]|nr:hypothetical protein [Anaerolineae bacterium]
MAESKNVPAFGYGDYLRFSRLVSDLFGLCFPEKRRTDLEQGVLQAFAASTCRDLADYYRLLLDPDGGAVHLQRLVNALTIGESHFFRNAGQFDALYKYVLPEIIERRRPLRTLRIWSAGCSSGQEPYSIAIMLRELLPDIEDWAITILGTDINTEALDRARKGVYSDWAFRETRAKSWCAKYFSQIGKRYQLNSEVQRMVTFSQLNLAEDHYPSFGTNTTFMDLVMCRNVTIYFSTSVTRQVVGRFYDSLVDNGWLVVGHSEHSLTTYRQFQAQSYPNAILYQRTGQPTVLPEEWDWLPAVTTSVGVPSLRIPQDPSDGQLVDQKVSPLAAVQWEDKAQQQGSSDLNLIEHARELMDYGYVDKAQHVLLDIVDQEPDHIEAAALLCQSYANSGCWGEAELWCRKAITLDNLALEPYYTLSLVLQHRGEILDAIEAMKKVVYLDRTSIRGHYGLADLYHSRGLLRQALKSLDNAKRLLSGWDENEIIPGSGGITAGRLSEAITRQLQQWRAEASEMAAQPHR